MFYSTDILSHRKPGLGIIWLAATLGDRSAIRRLSRKEILSVNITLTCSQLLHPSEPFALRLSSQLLFGIVKLYSHQTELLFGDVSNVHSDVRRRMLSTTTEETKEIDMRKSRKEVEAITLPLDLAFFTLDFDRVGSGMVSRWSVEPFVGRQVEREVEDGFRTPTPVGHLAEEERITLPERAFEEEELGLGRAYEEGQVPAYGGVEQEEFEGLDLGLEPPTRPEPFEMGAPEGIEQRFQGDESMATDFIVEWPELEERLAQEAARMEVGPMVEGVPTVTPARRPREEEEEEGQVEGRRAPAVRPPRPPPLPFEDRTTTLSEAQLRTARLNYPSRMASERASLQRRTALRTATALAHSIMFAPPTDLSLHPDLSELWQQTVSSHLVARRARFRSMHTAATLSPIADAPPSPPPPTPVEEEEIEELGVARTAPEIPTALRGPRSSLPWNIFAEHRRRSSMLPSISYDREITPLRLREVSVETPTGLRRIPPESPLFIPPPSPSTIAPLEEYTMPETPSERFRVGLPAAGMVGEEKSPTPPEVGFEQDLEEETRNFLEYAKSIREELEDTIMFFSDLAPVASSTPAVAAQAFYHLLALTSKARFKVRQEESYAEIRVTLLNP